MPTSVPLASLPPGAVAVVEAVEPDGPVSRRLVDLGFVPETEVRVVRRAPLGDPSEYAVRGTRLCLRRSEADRVRVQPVAPTDAARPADAARPVDA